MKLWKTIVVSGAVLVVAGAIVVVMMNQSPQPTKAEASETEWRIESAVVKAGLFRPQIRLVGQLTGKRQQTVTTSLSAEVMALEISEGSLVRIGDLLLRLNNFETRQQLEQVEADLADIEAQRQLRLSQETLDRRALTVESARLDQLQGRLTQQLRLVERGLAPQQQAEDLQQQVNELELSVLRTRTTIESHPAELARLDAGRRKLELDLERAQRALAETDVRAPFNGRVSSVDVRLGQTTQPGQALLTLYSDDAMQLQLQLPASLAGRDQALNAMLEQGDRQTELYFDRAQALLNASQSGFTAWFDLADGTGWLPGGYARATLQLPALFSYRVPEAAVFQDGWVYRISDERRLEAAAVEVLGIHQQDDSRWLIVQGPELDGDLRLLTTRLHNPVTGMLVHEPGVDPDPVSPSDVQEEQSIGAGS